MVVYQHKISFFHTISLAKVVTVLLIQAQKKKTQT